MAALKSWACAMKAIDAGGASALVGSPGAGVPVAGGGSVEGHGGWQ